MQKHTFSFLVFCLALSACASSVPYTAPHTNAPAAWSQASTGNETPTPVWWKNFRNAELDALMADALAQNTDIKASVQRIAQARADLAIAGADLLPNISGSGGGSLTRTDPSSGKATTTRRVDAGLDISYDLDLFGGNAAAKKAAEAGYDKAVYDSDALALATMADTARGFFTLLGLRDRIAIANENVKNAEDILRIVNARFAAGTASGIDVARQNTTLGNTRASLTALTTQALAAQNALAVLTGRMPQDITITTQSTLDIHAPAIDAGQPSDLLQRRPDIAAAEAALRAAHANIDTARAALYPSVTLGSGLSLVKSPLSDPASTALSLAASLAVPIFNGGRLQAGVEKTTAREAELLETYRGTILTAFQEVEDAMDATRTAAARVDILTATAQDAQKAYTLTRKQYDAGAIDLEALINVQDSLLNTQNSLSQARTEALSTTVDLYRALGGGYRF